MSEPYIGEIKMFAGNFAPRGWALCDGALLAVSSNDALFSLLGTIYGGDGRTTFGLPELRGRIPIHMGSGPGLSSRAWGQKSGSESVTVTAAQLPVHQHAPLSITEPANTTNPAGALPAQAASATFRTSGSLAAMASGSVGNTGGSQAHPNVQPFLCVNFIIALTGVYPSRN